MIGISLVASLNIILSNKWITKALIRLGGCADWSGAFVVSKPPKTDFLTLMSK